MPQDDSANPLDGGVNALAALQPSDRFAIEDLMTEFGWRADHGGAGTIAELFVADGAIVTPMFTLQGREQIAAHFSKRNAGGNVVSRHQWSNLRLEVLSDGDVQAQTIVQTHVGTRNGAAPVQPDHSMEGDSIDRVRRDVSGAWRFVERRLVITFRWTSGTTSPPAVQGSRPAHG